jgi:hypothetical protein
MEAASERLFENGATSARLPLVSVENWFSKLSEASIGADDQTMKRIVSSYAFLFMVIAHLTDSPACDQAP